MNKTEKETRLADIANFSVEERAEEDGAKKLIIEGYAAVYDSETNIADCFLEEIAKGAFEGADMRDVPLKYNHVDSVPILARTRNKSLKLTPDEKGLFVHAELLDTTDGVDMYKRIQAGLIDKMSFAFTIEEAVWEWFEGEEDKKEIRTITKIDKMFDVSVVDFPAYDQTEIYARNKEAIEKEIDEFHRLELAKEKLKLKLSL